MPYKDKAKKYKRWLEYYHSSEVCQKAVREGNRRRMQNPEYRERQNAIKRQCRKRWVEKWKVEGRCIKCGHYLPEEDTMVHYSKCCSCRLKQRTYNSRRSTWGKTRKHIRSDIVPKQKYTHVWAKKHTDKRVMGVTER